MTDLKRVSLEQEKAAADELERLHFITMYQEGRKNPWFVGRGSHGGDAPTLRRAMKKCLACCGIWRFSPELVEQCRDIAERHLGGWGGTYLKEAKDD